MSFAHRSGFFSKLFRVLKTFPQFVQILIELIDNCINKKTIKNTGQLPKCLIRDHHEAIIPREQFNAVQFEMENSAENMHSAGSYSALNTGQRIAEWCGRSTARNALYGAV